MPFVNLPESLVIFMDQYLHLFHSVLPLPIPPLLSSIFFSEEKAAMYPMVAEEVTDMVVGTSLMMAELVDSPLMMAELANLPLLMAVDAGTP